MSVLDSIRITEAYSGLRLDEALTIPSDGSDQTEDRIRELLSRKDDWLEHGDRVIRWYRHDLKAGRAPSELKSTFIDNLPNLIDLCKTYDSYARSLKASAKVARIEVERTDGKKAMLDPLTDFDKIRNYRTAMDFVNAMGEQIYSGGGTVTSSSKYAIKDADLKNIRLLGTTNNVMVWETATYASTNKFVYQLWRNAKTLGRGDIYGDPTEQTPYCTHSKQHWDDYSESFGELYRQYWFLQKLDDGLDYTPGDLTSANVSLLFNGMEGLGPEILIAMNDSGGDLLDRNDSSPGYDDEEIAASMEYGGEVVRLNNTVVSDSIDVTMDKMTKSIYDFIHKAVARGYKMNVALSAAKTQFSDVFKVIRSFTFPEGTEIVGATMFDGCTELRHVVLPRGCRSVGERAFNGCTRLQDVVLPEGLELIRDEAFRNCSALERIDIPRSVTSIGRGAFSGSGLGEIDVPDSVRDIGQGAFMRCSRLRRASIGNSVTSISIDMFEQCHSLMDVSLGSSVLQIDIGAFCNCSNLQSVSLPDSLVRIEESAFMGCQALKLDKLPPKVEKIGSDAFTQCGRISTDLPPRVEKINELAFFGCGSIVRVTLPDSLFSGGLQNLSAKNAFSHCGGIREVVISKAVYDKLSAATDKPEEWLLNHIGRPPNAKVVVVATPK